MSEWSFHVAAIAVRKVVLSDRYRCTNSCSILLHSVNDQLFQLPAVAMCIAVLFESGFRDATEDPKPRPVQRTCRLLVRISIVGDHGPR